MALVSQVRRILFSIILVPAACVFAQMTSGERAAQVASFELVWSTIRDNNPDASIGGLNWQAIHDSFRPRIEKAKSVSEVRRILRELIAKPGVSHYAIIPGDLYAAIGDVPTSSGDSTAGIDTVILDGKAVVKSVAPDSPAARAGVQPGMVVEGIDGSKIAPLLDTAGALNDTESRRMASRAVVRKLNGPADTPVKLDLVDSNGQPKHLQLDREQPKTKIVQFGNLPGMRVEFESRALPGGAGYIRFNEFLDPVTLMPRFESALRGFSAAPGVVLDLRGNPGGIGIMAAGVAGFFIGESGHLLGEMKMRGSTLKFAILPRPQVYPGKVAVLIDEGSASTSEMLAQGLQDLKRARIFGTRSAGAALPSDIIRLPNGDGFQYPTASYTSAGGRILEGNGVIPDVEVHQGLESIAAGRDPVIDAAVAWIGPSRQQ
jgi:carboxyl-terminal processing protease